MLKNFLKIAVRNLFNNKVYTFINILGLSFGIASSMLIVLHVEDELSYDSSFKNSDQIYKMVLERKYPDHVTHYAVVPHSFSEVLVREYHEVKNAVRLTGNPANNPVMVSYTDKDNNQKKFEETDIMFADSTFFEVFNIELIKGNAKEALLKPQDMVITESMAKKYFGDEDPINKTMVTDFGEFTVTAVSKDFEGNTHFNLGLLCSLNAINFYNLPNFTGFSCHMYLLLNENTNVEGMEAKFDAMVETYAGPQIEANLNTTYEEYRAAGNGYIYSLLPLEDIHLSTIKYEGEFKTGADINDIYIFISIALLIIIIAYINFMNLATARSTERAKEVGIRKTLGSQKTQLITQFLTESVVISSISAAFAFLLVRLSLPIFNTLIEKSLQIGAEGSMVIPLTIISAIIIGLLAGIYPAFILSSYNPVIVLKGSMKTGKNMSWLRNGLVVFQFCISIILICGTFTIKNQIDYITQNDLGFDKDQIIFIERANALGDQREVFINELKAMPEIASTGSSNLIPVNNYIGIQFMPQGATEPITTNSMTMDDDFISTVGLEIIKGRGFSESFNDSLSLIVNEQTVALLGVEDPIGMKLRNTIPQPDGSLLTLDYEIVGVVKDFHYMSLRNKISPFVLLSAESNQNGVAGFVVVKIKGGDISSAITAIENKWNEITPADPLKYKFLDDELDKQYKAEMNSGKIFGLFAGLGILIACVGLFGLAAYITSLRTKEIGIRKTLGASVNEVVFLLSKDFTKYVIVAVALGIPISIYLTDIWLSNFAYKSNPSWVTYFISGAMALFISWVTVGYQTVKAAVVNPVESLKNE